MSRIAATFTGAIAVAWLSISPASGAQFNASTAKECRIQLSGPIEKGDLERFEAAAAKAGWTANGKQAPYEESTGDRILCMASPGGSFAEGQKIAARIYELGIGTRLEAGALCVSACANIFMAGRLDGFEADESNRLMHKTAVLGFHAPYLDLAGRESASVQDVEDAFAVANLIIADMMNFASKRGAFSWRPVISASLIQSMLTKGPNELELVDTIEDAARWDIGILDVKSKWQVSEKMAVQACTSMLAWGQDQAAETIEDDSQFLTQNGISQFKPAVFPGESDNRGFQRLEMGGYVEVRCHIALRDEGWTGLEICTLNSGVQHGICPDFGFWIPAFYGLPPKTLLKDLP